MISVDSILSNERDFGKLDDLCRLCGLLKDSTELIFDDAHEENYDVINIYFRDEFQICRNDVLPRKVCRNCLTSVESWNQFYINCVCVNEKFSQIVEKYNLTKEEDKKPNDMNNDIEVIEVSVEGETYDFFTDQVDTNQLSNVKFTSFSDTGNYQNFDNVIEDMNFSTYETTTTVISTEKNINNQLSSNLTECNANVSKNEITEESRKMNEPHLVSVPTCEQAARDDLSLPAIAVSKNSLSDPRVPAEFEKFLRKHSNNIKYMQCDKCDFICRPLMTLFLKHYQKHVDSIEDSIFSGYMEELNNEVANEPSTSEPDTSSTVGGKRFQCGKCTKSFNKRKSFGRHLKIHEKRVYHCNECESKFKTKLAFKAHKERHRRPKELLHCDQCDKYFRSKDGYKYHRENRCILIKCRSCEQQFNQTDDLKKHMKQNHDITMSDTEQERQLEALTSMCFICGKIVKDSNLERHMIIHMEEKPFACDLCGKSFKSKSAIRDHMMIKLGMKDYVCEICGRKFVKKCYLNKHIRFHAATTGDQKNFQCDVCSKRFTDKKMYVSHKRSSHDPEKPFLCDLCNKSFASKTYLRQHLLREVICVLCDEIFTSNDLLKQHVISIHTLDKYRERVDDENDTNPAFVYPCEICGRKFTSEKSYKQHQLTELTCELCEGQFSQSEELKNHIENKHDPTEYRKVMSLRWKKHIKSGGVKTAEYPCNLCGKKLFYRRTLLLHMRMHSGLKPYKCEYCNKAYTSKHSLNAHLISEMNLRKFACSYCGKKYNFNSDLIVHIKQRHESRQFSCHVCGKKFGLLKYLKDHSTIHSQIKPFNCDKCKLGFRLRKFLIRHNKKYHSAQDDQVFYIEVGADE